MEDFIKKIVDMENEAKKIVEDAERRQAAQPDELAGEFAAMEAEIRQRADVKLEKLKKIELDDQTALIAGIEKESAAESETLERVFAANKDKWVEEITERVIAV